MHCEAAPDRPAIPPEYAIEWQDVQTVAQARAKHEAFVRSVRSRENIVASYIVDIEGRLFVCSNNVQWWRDYWAGLPAE